MFLIEMKDKIFKSIAGEEFGVIGELQGALPPSFDTKIYTPFAEDECGNYFIERCGEISFWDHETAEFIKLASSIDDFLNALSVPDVTCLDTAKVKSAWIDPEFAEQLKTQM